MNRNSFNFDHALAVSLADGYTLARRVQGESYTPEDHVDSLGNTVLKANRTLVASAIKNVLAGTTGRRDDVMEECNIGAAA